MPTTTDTLAELEAAWLIADAAPRGDATLTRIVQRTAPGVHATPEHAQITVAGGLERDRWSTGRRPAKSRQLTVMDSRVARFLAARYDQTDDMPGDNLLVDLPLGLDHVAVGDRLHIGADVIIEVTAAEHLGCKKFNARFGAAALAWVNHPDGVHRKLRGVNAKVIAEGEVRLGDPVRRG